MSKTQATRITITRAEGPVHLCGRKQVFEGPDCWASANAWLRSQSHTFPAQGGYDKHDFKVEFADGESWEGRLDCQHHTCEDPDLDVAQHIFDFANYGDMPKQMADFLDRYDLPV